MERCRQLEPFLSTVGRSQDEPLYRQIVQRLRDAIDGGHLKTGDRLPSERRLAEHFGFSRTTVQTAYAELVALGYLRSVPGSGTFVAGRPSSPGSASSPLEHAYAKRRLVAAGTFLAGLMRGATSPLEYGFEVGMPDPNVLPLHEFELVLRDLFATRARDVLSYSPTEGIDALRIAVARRLLPLRGLHGISPDHVMILTGSMQGLDLVGKLFIEPGDHVIVENPTFPGAIQTFRALGAELVPVPIDKDGLRVDELASWLERRRPKLIYTQPTLQNPTGAVLAEERRAALVRLASEYEIPVLEDDAYGLLWEGSAGAAAPKPLKGKDERGVVIYLSTFSKIVSPGLRVGYLVADPGVIRELSRLKQLTDLHTSTVSQLLVEAWLSTGDVVGHLRRCRVTYRQRIDAALQQMGEGESLQPFLAPPGGFYVFARLQGSLSAEAVRNEAIGRGISFAPGRHFAADGGFGDHLRLCVATLAVPTIRSGIQRLHRLWEELTQAGQVHRTEPV